MVTTVEFLLVAVLAVAAATDLRTGLIHNALTYPAIVFGLAGALGGLGPPPIAAVAGCLVGGGALYLAFLTGGMGGGDVKLMAAVGAFLGLPAVIDALFFSLLAGGLHAALLLLWRHRGRSCATACPFGVAIALGTTTALVLARIA